MRVSIIIPVNDDFRIGTVVAALESGLPPDVEILVADDGAPGRLSNVSRARVVSVHGANAGAARNTAAQIARGDILLFTDADVVLPSGWIATALRNFEDPSVKAVQGNTRAIGKGSLVRHVDQEYERFVQSHAATGYADLCDTRCFGIRREIFDRFAFDPEDAFCEDASLGRRLFEAGVRICFDPEWFVGHHLRRSVSREIERLRTYAAASQRHFRRTGRDLFRVPGGPAPRGPGASLLRWTAQAPVLAPAIGHAIRIAALVLAPFSPLPLGIGAKFFDTARRLAILSARVHPGGTSLPGERGLFGESTP